MKWLALFTPLLFAARPLLDYHLVAVLRTPRARLARPSSLGLPTPNGHWVLIGL